MFILESLDIAKYLVIFFIVNYTSLK